MKFAIFLKSSLLFNSFYCLFLFVNKTLRLNNFKTRTDMNAKISVLIIFVEAIIYLLLYNLHDCTFKSFEIVRVASVCTRKRRAVLYWRITKPSTTNRRPTTDNQLPTHRQVLHRPTEHRQPTTDPPTIEHQFTDSPTFLQLTTNTLTY